MRLTGKSIEVLIDLVEVKLSTMEVWDREDKRVARELERALKELSAMRVAASGRRTPPVAGAALPLPH